MQTIGERQYMSFLNKAASGAVDSRKNSGGGSDESKEQTGIDVDFDETPFVRMSPTAFTTGVFPTDEGNPIIRFRNAQYNDERLDQGYLGLVVDSPESVVSEEEGTDGTVILKTDETDSTDYRLFDSNDAQTKVVPDGPMKGVKFGERMYEGEFVDELPDTRILLTISGASSKNVAKRLDKNGAVPAGMDEENGGTNGGLIEYKPHDLRGDGANEFTSRYSRDPELKEELYGQRIGVLLARREELDNENTGYVGQDGDASSTPLLGETENDSHTNPDEASYAELCADDSRPEREMYWYVIFNVETEEEIEVEETGQELSGYTYLDPDWGQFDPSVGGMPDDQWTFVEEYVEAVKSGEVDGDEATIRSNIADNADGFNAAPETDSMVNAIQNRV